MPECDICLTWCDPTLVMTMRSPDADDVTEVVTCGECSTALLEWMTDRWRASIAAHNRVINEIIRMLKLDVALDERGATPEDDDA